jgi:para-nitrobenzyl esterase
MLNRTLSTPRLSRSSATHSTQQSHARRVSARRLVASAAVLTASVLCLSNVGVAANENSSSSGAKATGVLKVAAEPIRIETGLIRGLIVGPTDDIQVYRGIPYAAPPVGKLRWKPPQQAHSWSGIRECFTFGAAAPQKPVALLSMFPGMALGAKTSEDCLYLNVWAPVRPSAEPLPVMVWIHGGGYTFGAASQGLYDGANLARRGVIVVAMNYRLGPLGFLSLPQLSAESEHGASGNYGLLDQLEALRWVKRNVAAFGGDPQRVTIFGESAGGNSVDALLVSPLAKGLFQRAISQSGATLSFPDNKHSRYGYPSAETMGLEFAKKCGVPEGPGQLAALRAMSADDVLKASAGFATPKSLEFRSDRARFSPVVDGWMIPDDPMTLLEQGKANPVPLIVGANANEGSLFILTTALPKSGDEYRSILEKTFGPQAAATLSQLYPASDMRRSVSDFVGDYLFVEPARLVARTMQQAKNPVYYYHFAHPTPGPMGKMLGAHHGAEIAFAMDNLQIAPNHSPADEQVRDALAGYWVQFAATGNPNRAGLPEWSAFDATTDRCLLLKDKIEMTQDLRKSKLDAIDGVLDAWRNESGLTSHPHTTATPAPQKSAQPNSQPAANKTTHVAPKAATQAARTVVAAHGELEAELRQARFLTKAGLGPIAVDSLKKIIKDGQGTVVAQEARRVLDSLPPAK